MYKQEFNKVTVLHHCLSESHALICCNVIVDRVLMRIHIGTCFFNTVTSVVTWWIIQAGVHIGLFKCVWTLLFLKFNTWSIVDAYGAIIISINTVGLRSGDAISSLENPNSQAVSQTLCWLLRGVRVLDIRTHKWVSVLLLVSVSLGNRGPRRWTSVITFRCLNLGVLLLLSFVSLITYSFMMITWFLVYVIWKLLVFFRVRSLKIYERFL